MNKVYYNSDTDEIYTLHGSVAWTQVSGCNVSVLFCGDCNFWHYIGDL